MNGLYSICDPQSFPEGPCYFCNCLRRLFTEEQLYRIELCEGSENLETPCTLHRAFFSWIRKSFHKEIDQRMSLGFRRLGESLDGDTFYYCRRNRGALPEIQYCDYKHRPIATRQLLFDKSPVEGQSDSSKHRFDSKWIDLRVARQWMNNCSEKHGSRCLNVFNVPPCFPAYLIDTELDCLITGKEGLEYVALSYRWGTRDSFKTKQSSFKHITKPGGLSIYTDQIPDTISHAMHVVRSIGKRYLWVDSICLISDDKKHLTEQLQLMGSIYACANMTIVALDDDAWAGLHGIQGALRPPSKPRDLPNIFPWLNDSRLIVRNLPLLIGYPHASEYFRRGWTYQEYILSQRRLIFGNQQIHWSCSCTIWHEDIPEAEQDYKDEALQYLQSPNIINGIPDSEELGKFLREYNLRDLTHPEDSLPGVTGLLETLSRTFKGGFLCGLPEAWFDAALMWNCNFYGNILSKKPDSILERRTLSGQPQSSLPGAVLPSWSWIGWKSNGLRILIEEQGFELPESITALVERKKIITTPITKWFSHDTPNSKTKRPIQSSSLQFQEHGINPEYLAQGWITEEFDAVRHFHENSSDPGFEDNAKRVNFKNVYRHPALPNKYFWRPFPMSRDNENTQLYNPQPHQYISCQTQRGWFHTRPIPLDLDRQFLSGMDTHISLTNDLNIECGRLQLPSKEASILHRSNCRDLSEALAKHEDPKSTKSSSQISTKIEVVAICQYKYGNHYTISSNEKNALEEFYGVLWIEWVDEVAYRRGCGYVEKKMWDEHPLENINLILG
jgi:hypothetical protein